MCYPYRMAKKTTDTSDSSRIRLIPEIMGELARLNRVIVTGDIEKGEPGLLENMRNIRKDVEEIKVVQEGREKSTLKVINDYESIDKRVYDIEERHKREDVEKERRSKRIDSMTVATFSIALSNVVMIILWLFGFGR